MAGLGLRDRPRAGTEVEDTMVSLEQPLEVTKP